MITIEHRLPDGNFATTIYAHLSGKRLVKTSDLVEAGQEIGEIGRKGVINGGFDPHLHFGVHEGRLGEEGVPLFVLQQEGESITVTLAKLDPTQIEITVPAENTRPARLTVNGEVFPITTREGKHYLPATMLWSLPSRPGFKITGYALTTDGWLDPTAFLSANGARFAPARRRSAN
jgi:murein DD-endopeptidase MepM/ murein hydrolase activator NlpD